jgi:hypothetical protein
MPNLALTKNELAELLQFLEGQAAVSAPDRGAQRGRERSEGAQSAEAHDHHHP